VILRLIDDRIGGTTDLDRLDLFQRGGIEHGDALILLHADIVVLRVRIHCGVHGSTDLDAADQLVVSEVKVVGCAIILVRRQQPMALVIHAQQSRICLWTRVSRSKLAAAPSRPGRRTTDPAEAARIETVRTRRSDFMVNFTLGVEC